MPKRHMQCNWIYISDYVTGRFNEHRHKTKTIAEITGWSFVKGDMSLVLRKTVFCICENKVAGQLRGNREADQPLCFRFTDSTIPLLPKSDISSPSHLVWLFSLVCVGPGRKPEDRLILWILTTGLKFYEDISTKSSQHYPIIHVLSLSYPLI